MSGQQIAEVLAGQRPTLLETQKANELIKAINALQNITIQYGETFGAEYGSNEVALTIPTAVATQDTTPIEMESVGVFVCVNGRSTRMEFLVKPSDAE